MLNADQSLTALHLASGFCSEGCGCMQRAPRPLKLYLLDLDLYMPQPESLQKPNVKEHKENMTSFKVH